MKIKEKPEDFVVEELIELKEEKGPFLYVKMTKINWNTIDAVNEISKRMRIPRKDISFAGIKDKKAVTTQYISLKNCKVDMINKIKIKDIVLVPLFYGKEAVNVGNLKGNKFKIKVDRKVSKITFVENYFGEQRFSKNNWNVGKAIIKKDFKSACELINDNRVNDYLQEHKNDYIGALRIMDRKILILYVNSYQSYLFNWVLREYILKNYSDFKRNEDYIFVNKIKKRIKIPLIAFDTEFHEDYKEIYLKILEEEGLELKDFIMKQLQEVMPITEYRDCFVDVLDFHHKGADIYFSLPKGSYATVVIKKLEVC